ncbi:MAG: cell division protein FtsL [Gammaproteobacteria bacterium]|nr:cell division protein FtsL [Gammaproteobacteria bacterium]
MVAQQRTINLSKVIWSDLIAHFWLVMLVLSVLVTAIFVVYSSHQNRLYIGHWEELRQQRDELKLEARHLLVEEMALAEHSRIERIAMEQLQMKRPQTQKEIAVSSK